VAERPRLPKFQFLDEVRVLSATGAETDNSGWPVDGASLIGRTVEVADARPSNRRDQWLFAVDVRVPHAIDPQRWWFAADCLERIGPRGTVIWDDHVDLNLVTDVYYFEPEKDEEGYWPDTEEEKQTEQIAKAAVRALRRVVPARVVDMGTCVSEDEPIEIQIEVRKPRTGGGILDAYLTIVSEPARAWLHGEDARGFPKSCWEPPDGGDVIFLAPGIDRAEVTCEHWSTPERLLARSVPRRRSASRSPRASS
jgi:hypothetical protein